MPIMGGLIRAIRDMVHSVLKRLVLEGGIQPICKLILFFNQKRISFRSCTYEAGCIHEY